MSKRNLLRDLLLKEVSLVDRGANDGARVQLFKREETEQMSSEDVKKIQAELDKVRADNAVLAKAAKEQLAAIEELTKAKAKMEEELLAYQDEEEDDEEDEGMPALKKHAEEVTKRLAAQETEIKKFADDNAKLRAQIHKRDVIAKVEEDFPNLAKADHEAISDTLIALEGNEGGTETYRKALKAQNDAIAASLNVIGAGATGDLTKGAAMVEATAKAQELMKAHPGKYRGLESARAEVWKMHPELLKRYQDERGQSDRGRRTH